MGSGAAALPDDAGAGTNAQLHQPPLNLVIFLQLRVKLQQDFQQLRNLHCARLHADDVVVSVALGASGILRRNPQGGGVVPWGEPSGDS